MRVVLTTRARGDIREIHNYLRMRSPTGAENILRRIRQALLHLRDQPEIGLAIEIDGVRRMYVGRYPYVAYYRLRQETVEILHIRHTSRSPVAPDELG